MGDDRPNVYVDDDAGVIVYRASAVGGCEQALRYARKGTDKRPVFDTMQKAMDESAALETPILEALQRKCNVDYSDSQKQVIVPTGLVRRDGVEVVIRGSIDSIIRANDTMQLGLGEVKAFGDEYWELYQREGIEAFPHYVTQFHTYVAGLRADGWDVDGGWFIVGHKVDGKLVGTPTFDWIPFKAAEVAKAKAKVRRVEGWYAEWFAATDEGREAMEDAECNLSPVCGYWYLHEKKELPTVEHRNIRLLLMQRDAAAEKRDKEDARVKELTGKIAGELERGTDGAFGKDVMSVKAGNDGEYWTVTKVKDSVTVKWNKAKLATELGDRLGEFQSTSTKAGYVKITKGQ